MRLLGIDPGVTGALAILEDGRLVKLLDMPTAGGEVDAGILHAQLAWLQQMEPVEWCFLEQTHAMPSIGSKANYSQGFSLGTIIACLKAVAIPFERVRPTDWKIGSGLRGKAKDASLALARELWPDQAGQLNLAKHHNRAEAALIARHGLLTRIHKENAS
jgi:crossover junction endodeoxyribonuclease RuvC